MTNTEKEGLKPGYLPSFRKMVKFPEFLKLVKQYPELIQSSFERMERLIVREGRDEQREARLALLGYPKNIKAYNAFSKRFKGIDPAIHRFCNDFIAAGAAGAEPSKQIFVGIGGKGSGKSQFFNKVKSILRQFEPVPYCKSSTVHDNPAALFYMIPTLAEREFDKEKSDDVDNYETRIVELRAELLTASALRICSTSPTTVLSPFARRTALTRRSTASLRWTSKIWSRPSSTASAAPKAPDRLSVTPIRSCRSCCSASTSSRVVRSR